ncbi:MAG: glutamine-hydrolyzing carbamoyl-phosphate synthase small subunit [Pseudomonadota bacterium]|nr:glutamine-hydrolyzing carbamoyl-phosphate synthase small subunit [Pseudomonadota bacterium]MEC9284957.1 glutamine-hydrolyzing carbamoyl-phosphate synthase small subunit [Pseudomonadota bacterium]HBP14699.1 carbamoyl-phosphate synthase small subunit [Gammaproteobacteria bacterium]HCP50386.1 carbamoyl-phosphate synthase small subunit [Gammaproteobacteria bacterium]
MKPAILVLEDGSVFRGRSIGIPGMATGEVVFNTAMTGYQEILTDPSYARQIITLTYPHIGNTGTNDEDMESDRVWADGLVIRDLPVHLSSWRASHSLADFLQDKEVVAIDGIDTRRLTRILRQKGSMRGCLVADEELSEQEALAQTNAFPGLAGMDLAKVVSRQDVVNWKGGSWCLGEGYAQSNSASHKVVAYDFGVKRAILRLLVDRGCDVTLVPATTPAEAVMAMRPDGVFLSNGPGDPDPCEYAIASIREFLETELPLFGICLGCQLLALASDAKTVKMTHGHHGANHPVQDLSTGRVIITSQNHGFAVDGDSLPQNLKITHVSLFDGSLQGLARTDKPAFGFQGHPEASPGPQDCAYLFDRFVQMMSDYRNESPHA